MNMPIPVLITIVVLAAIVAAIVKTPWFKGHLGEFLVNCGLKFFLDKKVYHLIGEYARKPGPEVLKDLTATGKAYGVPIPYRGQF